MDSVGWIGLVPSLQFPAVGRDEAQHDDGVKAPDENRLEASAGRFDSERVRIIVALDVRHTLE